MYQRRLDTPRRPRIACNSMLSSYLLTILETAGNGHQRLCCCFKKNLANPWSLPKCIVCPSIRNVAPRPHKSTGGIGFSASRRAKRSVAVCTASMADDRVYTEEEVSLPYGICYNTCYMCLSYLLLLMESAGRARDLWKWRARQPHAADRHVKRERERGMMV